MMVGYCLMLDIDECWTLMSVGHGWVLDIDEC